MYGSFTKGVNPLKVTLSLDEWGEYGVSGPRSNVQASVRGQGVTHPGTVHRIFLKVDTLV